MSYNQRMLDFIHRSPTCYQAVEEGAKMLREAGFQPLDLGLDFTIEPGGSYYLTQNLGALIAFRVPKEGFGPFAIAESHCDSPALRIRGDCTAGGYLRLVGEPYGGPVLPSWLDRPLTAAGRVTLRTLSGVCSRPVNLGRAVMAIPSVAPHLRAETAGGAKLDICCDLLPLAGLAGGENRLLRAVAAAAGCRPEEITGWDLFAVSAESGFAFGLSDEFICSPRLDNLSSVFGSLEAICRARPFGMIPVAAVFNREETGSSGTDGAGSTLLAGTVRAIAGGLNAGEEELRRALAWSFAVSCDNGHGLHPNHPELHHPCDRPELGGGIMIKQSPLYATDSFSAGVFSEICRHARVPVQYYSNRADKRGGSTLGNISIGQLTLPTVDIGLPQLAMHSTMETMAASDPERMQRALQAFFSTRITRTGDCSFSLDFGPEPV